MVKQVLLSSKYPSWMLFSVLLNLFLIANTFVGGEWASLLLNWSSRAAAEAEAVAEIGCSGHGRAYLDGLLGDGNEPVCECNTCYTGPNCSEFIPHCTANADGGDPLFLEPFWMQHSTSSALVVSGWHRMSYNYNDNTWISSQLESLIRKLHAFVSNAVTRNRYIVFGAGSTQILNAAAYALSLENTSSQSPTRVIASVPYYSLYKNQVEYFDSEKFEFEGDDHTWRNTSANVIEFVTSPNNPDGQLNKAIVDGPNVKTIYDRAYYWPHFTPIPAPADEDFMVFTLSKLTGHAGSRFGWAIIKDETVFNRMIIHIQLNSLGVSKDTQLRAFKLLKAVLEEGTEIFDFGYRTMKMRWDRLVTTLSLSNRFSLQKFNPQYCIFYCKIRDFSPAYAWVKCEREEDNDCHAVLKAANIIGRQGNVFGSKDRYVRLSLVRSQDDFDILIQRLQKLVSEEVGSQTT
ncbi:Tryptophan aminotransferase-related protein 4 [Hibiscus syriacus]|uniref:Tryptophan aminotransferase-related protein 4 n=1 Tax=Hibiscus syriacus TaxID=106335 RepID=A0A6A2ZTX4_HIBSY|nr:tryptophan aminotransferase-related protein 4-like [Hibiscus syriacus]KAE8694729.1 Tryptophan aminotransferase-related protein 4 [Hibiscus syriacus]